MNVPKFNYIIRSASNTSGNIANFQVTLDCPKQMFPGQGDTYLMRLVNGYIPSDVSTYYFSTDSQVELFIRMAGVSSPNTFDTSYTGWGGSVGFFQKDPAPQTQTESAVDKTGGFYVPPNQPELLVRFPHGGQINAQVFLWDNQNGAYLQNANSSATSNLTQNWWCTLELTPYVLLD